MNRVLSKLFKCHEAIYHRIHHLQHIGSMLYLGTGYYHGSARIFADGTYLKPGDMAGFIHFDNECLADLYSTKNASGAAFSFTRLLLKSFYAVAERVVNDPAFQSIQVFTGITWFKPHGSRFGFCAGPLPDGLKKKLLNWHFRLLLRMVLPAGHSPSNSTLEPHQFYLTRQQLLQHFAHEKSSHD